MGRNRWGACTGLAVTALLVGSAIHTSVLPAEASPAGRTFYLDPTGSDHSDGRSPGSAWRSLEKASEFSFRPGDRLLLRGGAVFPGSLEFDATDSLSGQRVLTVGSFGSGPATITATGGPAVYVHDTAGIEIHDLILVGEADRDSDGLTVFNETDRRLEGVTISRVEVSGFKNGISVGGTASGFRDVRISQSAVHDNVEAGVITYGPEFDGRYANESVTVRAVESFGNTGDRTNVTRNTGNGIVLGSVDGGRVDLSNAHDNGWECFAPEGPAGIWAYDSRSVVLEYNVARRNRTGAGADGDGFDLDQNTSSSLVQFNFADENDGAGFLLYAAREDTANHGNVIRHNVSRDSRAATEWYGALTVMGHVTEAEAYGNSMTVSSSPGLRPPTVRLQGPLSGVSLRHNRLVSNNGGALVAASGFPDHRVTMLNNSYHQDSGWRVEWGDVTYHGLDAWRSATMQETTPHR